MKWIIWSSLLLLALAGLVMLIGWMLPVEHEATVSVSVGRTPDEVYAAIANVAAYPEWVDGVKRIDMLDNPDGRVRFRQHTGDGPLVMEVERVDPPSLFSTRIADPGQPFGGSWTFEITPEASGSRVQVTERGEVYNPIFRFVARFIIGHTKTIRSFLASLQRHLE
jgi:uncharacterized protein YndB with AHSA1/START domain